MKEHKQMRKIHHPTSVPPVSSPTAIPSGAQPITPDDILFVNSQTGVVSPTQQPGDDLKKYHFTLPDNLDTGHVTEVYGHDDTNNVDLGALGGSTGPSFVWTQFANPDGTFDTISFQSLTLN